MQRENDVTINSVQLKPLIDQLVISTSGPGEGAAVCLVLFVELWRQFHEERNVPLDEIADAARTMILSYDRNVIQ